MADTISFTAKADNAHYTLAEINDLFTAVAAVINAKLDLEVPVLGDDNFNAGTASFINVGDGVDDDDAVTLAQFRTMAGL